MIYHITSAAAWGEALAQGEYRAESLADEGFIHCARREQVLPVARAFYAGQVDRVILCIDERLIRAPLRWEAPSHPHPPAAGASGLDALFPHIYGPLDISAVRVVVAWDCVDGGGMPQLP